MGKSKKRLLEKLNEIEQLSRDIQKQRKRIVVECPHQNDKGKLKLEAIDDEGTYRCKFCKSTFNMTLIPRDKLNDAVETLHNALQQIRCFSDPRDEHKLIRIMGELDFNLQESAELYERIVNIYGRGGKKKKDRDREDSFGEYGTQGLSFIGTGKKKK